MPFILVSSLSNVERMIEQYHPSHLVTPLSPEYMIEAVASIGRARSWQMDASSCCRSH